MIVFDLDGCLVDTRALICRAYAKAGSPSIRTRDAYRHYTEWLVPAVGLEEAERIRARKTTLYLEMLQSDTPPLLAAGHKAMRLMAGGKDVRVVTAGHSASARAVLRAAGLGGAIIVGTEVLPASRPEILRALSATGTYYDDNERTCALVRRSTGWLAVHSD